MSVSEETSVYTNGFATNESVETQNVINTCMNGDYDMDLFLFTSESVGEGHPGLTLLDNFN